MSSSNQKISDAKIQALLFTFKFTQQDNKLIIQATDTEQNEIYFTEIIANPLIDFGLVQQLIQQGEYKILSKQQSIIKIRLGIVNLQLVSKSKSQIKDLKDIVNKSLQKQSQLQKIIQTQKTIIGKYQNMVSNLNAALQQQQFQSDPKVTLSKIKEMEKDFSKKFNEIKPNLIQQQKNTNILTDPTSKNIVLQKNELTQPFKWSQTLKSSQIQIQGNVITLINNKPESYFCLFEDILYLEKKSFAMRYVKGTNFISLGICLKSIGQKESLTESVFGTDGCYQICPNGQIQGYTKNHDIYAFQFKAGDTVYMEYDPFKLLLKFSLNHQEKKYQMPIIPPPDDNYHPFVLLENLQDTVEIIQGKPLS